MVIVYTDVSVTWLLTLRRQKFFMSLKCLELQKFRIFYETNRNKKSDNYNPLSYLTNTHSHKSNVLSFLFLILNIKFYLTLREEERSN